VENNLTKKAILLVILEVSWEQHGKVDGFNHEPGIFELGMFTQLAKTVEFKQLSERN
jgi:hypothetical protein